MPFVQNRPEGLRIIGGKTAEKISLLILEGDENDKNRQIAEGIQDQIGGHQKAGQKANQQHGIVSQKTQPVEPGEALSEEVNQDVCPRNIYKREKIEEIIPRAAVIAGSVNFEYQPGQGAGEDDQLAEQEGKEGNLTKPC